MIALVETLAGDAQVAIEFLHDMDGKTDGASLIHQGALDGLAYPPSGISGETKPSFGIELLHRPQKTEIALLH